MIMFYDLLLLDDILCIHESHNRRRRRLWSTVHLIPGRADIGPRGTQKSGFTAAGPYDIEHVSLDNYAVYTNEPPAGALRGFGISQLVWAYERQMDIIARALAIDPLELRRRNVLRAGRNYGWPAVSYGRVYSGPRVSPICWHAG